MQGTVDINRLIKIHFNLINTPEKNRDVWEEKIQDSFKQIQAFFDSFPTGCPNIEECREGTLEEVGYHD